MGKTGRKPNIVHLAIDSLRADHMSCYGYGRQTTPHIDRWAARGTIFERNFSPHIPTTSGYTSMLTGTDCITNQVVALRHQGPLRAEVRTLPEILADQGYATTCVGFRGNPASRGFQNYIDFAGWGSRDEGRSPKAQNLNDVTIPELNRLADAEQPFYLFLRHMDPHSPYLPPAPYERMFYHGDECDRDNHTMDACMTFKPFCDYFAAWLPPGISDAGYVVSQYDGAIAYMDACIETIFFALEARGIVENTLHVPLILVYPGKVPAGQRVSGFTFHKDMVPTVLELCGLDAPGCAFDGSSVMDLVRGEAASHESEF